MTRKCFLKVNGFPCYVLYGFGGFFSSACRLQPCWLDSLSSPSWVSSHIAYTVTCSDVFFFHHFRRPFLPGLESQRSHYAGNNQATNPDKLVPAAACDFSGKPFPYWAAAAAHYCSWRQIDICFSVLLQLPAIYRIF